MSELDINQIDYADITIDSPEDLKHRYLVMRHGESEANVAGIIISLLETGVPKYGLTENGKEQARQSSQKAIAEELLDENTIIYSSPFKRNIETAEIVKDILGAHDVIIDDRLRERYFGDLEEKSNAAYKDVWEKDSEDIHHEEFGVESAAAVVYRMTKLISEIEKQDYPAGSTIVLVAHGDTLQLIQTWFHGVSPAEHRSLPHLETAEIRRVWPKK